MFMTSKFKLILSATLLIFPRPPLAAEVENTEKITITSEPTKCYAMVWGSVEKGLEGMGLTAGQAVTLCGGTTSAETVIRCFIEAWAPTKSGGLGLNAGQAIGLCKTNSVQ